MPTSGIFQTYQSKGNVVGKVKEEEGNIAQPDNDVEGYMHKGRVSTVKNSPSCSLPLSKNKCPSLSLTAACERQNGISHQREILQAHMSNGRQRRGCIGDTTAAIPFLS